MKKRIDVASTAIPTGTGYPAPFDEPCRKRVRHFGVNLLRLPPGAWSSQRHWHT
jgi:uncharacterized cupin superfamily protein